MSVLNKLTVRHLKLNKKRTAVTIIGVILSTAMIAAIDRKSTRLNSSH